MTTWYQTSEKSHEHIHSEHFTSKTKVFNCRSLYQGEFQICQNTPGIFNYHIRDERQHEKISFFHVNFREGHSSTMCLPEYLPALPSLPPYLPYSRFGRTVRSSSLQNLKKAQVRRQSHLKGRELSTD